MRPAVVEVAVSHYGSQLYLASESAVQDTIQVSLSLREVRLLLGAIRDKQLRKELGQLEHQLEQGCDKLQELAARQNSLGHMESEKGQLARISKAAKIAAEKRRKLLARAQKLDQQQLQELLK